MGHQNRSLLKVISSYWIILQIKINMFYESFRNKISRWSIWHSFRVYQTYILICQNETPYTAWNHAQCALHPDVLVLLEAKFRLFGFYEACEFVIVICMFGLSLSIKFVKKLTMMICLLVWEGQIINDSRVEGITNTVLYLSDYNFKVKTKNKTVICTGSYFKSEWHLQDTECNFTLFWHKRNFWDN